MENKVIVITGCTSGVGYAALKKFCKNQNIVIGIGRSKEKCSQVENEINSNTSATNLKMFQADLSSQQQIAEAAEDIKNYISSLKLDEPRIDALINNAGTYTNKFKLTEEGIELQFAVNHMAPFILTNELLDLLKTSTSPKVLITSSGSHYGARIHWNNIMQGKLFYSGLKAYKQSKLANVLFAKELNDKYSKKFNLQAYAIDPGLVNTSIGEKETAGISKLFWQLRRHNGDSPEKPAKTIFFVVESDKKLDGVYVRDCKTKQPNQYVYKKDYSKRLWEVSKKYINANKK